MGNEMRNLEKALCAWESGYQVHAASLSQQLFGLSGNPHCISCHLKETIGNLVHGPQNWSLSQLVTEVVHMYFCISSGTLWDRFLAPVLPNPWLERMMEGDPILHQEQSLLILSFLFLPLTRDCGHWFFVFVFVLFCNFFLIFCFGLWLLFLKSWNLHCYIAQGCALGTSLFTSTPWAVTWILWLQ